MRIVFDTLENDDDFAVFENRNGNISFESLENDDPYSSFCFIMEKKEVKLLAEYLLKLSNEEWSTQV